MLTRTIALCSFGIAAVLFGASQSEAQPGKGPKGPEAGSDVKKLETDLARLLDQVKEAQAKLARAKEAGGKGKGPFEGKGGPDGKGKKGGSDGKGKDGPLGFERKAGGFGPGGFGPKGPDGAKLDPDTIKQKYEFYKDLYEKTSKPATRGKGPGGFGPFGPKGFEGKWKDMSPPSYGRGRPGDSRAPSRSLEARIDRLIRELEDLRSEVKGSSRRK
jgi:hypothetical protein